MMKILSTISFIVLFNLIITASIPLTRPYSTNCMLFKTQNVQINSPYTWTLMGWYYHTLTISFSQVQTSSGFILIVSLLSQQTTGNLLNGIPNSNFALAIDVPYLITATSFNIKLKASILHRLNIVKTKINYLTINKQVYYYGYMFHQYFDAGNGAIMDSTTPLSLTKVITSFYDYTGYLSVIMIRGFDIGTDTFQNIGIKVLSMGIVSNVLSYIVGTNSIATIQVYGVYLVVLCFKSSFFEWNNIHINFNTYIFDPITSENFVNQDITPNNTFIGYFNINIYNDITINSFVNINNGFVSYTKNTVGYLRFHFNILVFIFSNAISNNHLCCGNYPIDLGMNTCRICSYGCIACINSVNCSKCILGNVVYGGCTRETGCLAVSSDPISSPCTACTHEYILNNLTHTCDCPVGQWQVSGLCTNIKGCQVMKKINNISRCIYCNVFNKFVYNGSYGCNCVLGYQLNINQCKQVCGDGRLYDFKCDDGNLIEGDGCSSRCQIEQGYNCLFGSEFRPSVCFQIVKKLKAQLFFVNKLHEIHRGIFKFLLSSSNLHIYDEFITNITFKSLKNVSLFNWKLENKIVEVNLDYFETIQDFPASIIFHLNPNMSFVSQLAIDFNMDSNWVQLIYVDQDLNKIHVCCIVFFSISCIGAILSLSFHKLIALQTILTYQLIFFVYAFAQRKHPILQIFDYFSYMNFNIDFNSNKLLNFYSCNSQQIFSFQNLSNSLSLFHFIKLFSIVIIMVYFFITIEGKQINKFSKIIAFLYHKIIFPFFCAYIYLNVYLYQNNHLPFMLTFSILKYIQILIVILVVLHQLIAPFMINQSQLQSQIYLFGVKYCNRYYLPLFIIFILLKLSIIFAASVGMIVFVSQLILITTIIQQFIFIYMRPYGKVCHNFGQGFNLLLLLLFCTWISLRLKFADFFSLKMQYNFFMMFLLIMFICLILIFVRIYYQFKLLCFQKQVNKSIKNIKQIQKNQNQYILYKKNTNIYQFSSKIPVNNYNLSFNINKQQQYIVNQLLKQKKKKQIAQKFKQFL